MCIFCLIHTPDLITFFYVRLKRWSFFDAEQGVNTLEHFQLAEDFLVVEDEFVF